MNIVFSKTFTKDYDKAPQKVKLKFAKALDVFETNPSDRSLRKHILKGEYKNYLSIDVTGDWRAIFVYVQNTEKVTFVRLGTHSQLYK